MSRFLSLSVASLLTSLVLSASAQAAPTSTLFPVKNRQMTSLVRTPNGALWFGEYGSPPAFGKVGYDGALAPYATGLGAEGGLTLIPTQSNGLWIGTSAAPASGGDFFLASSTGTTQTFTPILPPNVRPDFTGTEMASTPDGALWFGLDSSSETAGSPGPDGIARLSADGSVATYSTPITGGYTDRLLAVGNGDIWFIDGNGEKNIETIGHLSPDGSIHDFTIPGLTGAPDQLILGSDGNVWFLATADSVIGKVTPAGVVSEYPVHLPRGQTLGPLSLGPDGALWFSAGQNAALTGYSLGRISSVGVVKITPLRPEALNGCSGTFEKLVLGPEGKMWGAAGGAVLSISTSSKASCWEIGPHAHAGNAVVGTDGNVWAASDFGITRINTNPSSPLNCNLQVPRTQPSLKHLQLVAHLHCNSSVSAHVGGVFNVYMKRLQGDWGYRLKQTAIKGKNIIFRITITRTNAAYGSRNPSPLTEISLGGIPSLGVELKIPGPLGSVTTISPGVQNIRL